MADSWESARQRVIAASRAVAELQPEPDPTPLSTPRRGARPASGRPVSATVVREFSKREAALWAALQELHRFRPPNQ